MRKRFWLNVVSGRIARRVFIGRAFAAIAVLGAITSWGCSYQLEQQPTLATEVTQAPRPLPFKGRLVEGDRSELPPAVAISLADNSSITFSYREELSHDEYHIPLVVTALDPVTYFGAPLGDYGVTAFASLSIIEGNKVIGDYTAKARISKSYTLYSEPTHSELEQAARLAVRERIDEKLYGDVDRLAQAASHADRTPTRRAK